ncbi:hypothetical protein M2360_003945 [Rhizobium sp. SG_E_25_P2]|uniref:hypothetical protein n=1 Tax=Rhizobium sp. SG_E_25_P2 TaxID=2879942 RepID=UPI0024752F85|nr:hypothetical protein [Rhizobium sp. SG_E_25_P2]MDH6268539.1 hypothetical protein [Rhizobium sp. SG_E_25_P2]
MNAWVGPAIVAAAISSVIGVLSLYLNAWLTLRLDRTRRLEKVRDVQIALLAEIRADIHNLRFFDLDGHLELVMERYRTIPGYVPKPSRSPPLLLEGLLKSDVQLLPSWVIDAVILYVRQKTAIELFVDDIRGDDFAKRDKELQMKMYADFINMKKVEHSLARAARDVLEASLEFTARRQ